MPKTPKYQENLEIIQPFITRNKNNATIIEATSFWINDVEQPNKQQEIEISTTPTANFITCEQENECCIYPIDGNKGMFRKEGLIVCNPEQFLLKKKPVGACDCLIINDKFAFIEFKTNASSESYLSVVDNRDKAILQLSKTLTYFQENMPKNTMTKSNASCLIVTPPFFPKISKIALVQNVRFLKDFKVPLLEKTTDEVVIL